MHENNLLLPPFEYLGSIRVPASRNLDYKARDGTT